MKYSFDIITHLCVGDNKYAVNSRAKKYGKNLTEANANRISKHELLDLMSDNEIEMMKENYRDFDAKKVLVPSILRDNKEGSPENSEYNTK